MGGYIILLKALSENTLEFDTSVWPLNLPLLHGF
jgi:hypothetical protein